ncbi:4Fe-4S binding protein [Sedimentibacter sp.]|uniref:4Fe-4S binding protein n=1 Tax=Sedimentibacter sp. TaxID=1960295 RepID=UPI0028999A60|nr:4Fe-4S binding protein [Sedimentibacter sp.]
MKLRKKALVNMKGCVACGTCADACPLSAINIVAGVFAEVNKNKCVGCSKCVKACPASTIEIVSGEEVA